MTSVPSSPLWFSERLVACATEAGCRLDEDQVRLLKLHAEWVFFWNRVVNLTAIRSWEELIVKHYLDSVVVASRWLPKSGRMLDIGSGAGFPGIPVKILSPQLEVTLCEIRRKKASFLKSFIATSGLRGIEVSQTPWQEIIAKELLKFDLITWRALKLSHSDITSIVDLGLRPGGMAVCWTTPSIAKSDMLAACSESKVTFGKGVDLSVFFYSLPGGIERAVVILRKGCLLDQPVS